MVGWRWREEKTENPCFWPKVYAETGRLGREGTSPGRMFGLKEFQKLTGGLGCLCRSVNSDEGMYTCRAVVQFTCKARDALSC